MRAQGTSLAAASHGQPRLCSHSAKLSTASDARVETGISATASNTVGTSTQLIAGIASRFTGTPMSGTEPNRASVYVNSSFDTTSLTDIASRHRDTGNTRPQTERMIAAFATYESQN